MSDFTAVQKKAREIVVGGLALLGAAAPARPSSAEDAAGGWQFRATAYAYLPDTSGTTSFPGATDISVAAKDIVDHTDSALMSAFEARKGRVGAFADVIAIDLSNAVTGLTRLKLGGGVALPPGVTADTSLALDMRAATFAAELRAYERPHASVDVLAGARLLDVDGTLGYAFSADFGPFVGPARDGARAASLHNWDAVVGAKGAVELGAERRWRVLSYADVGGGDSARTWQGLIAAGRKIGRFEVDGGWRRVEYRFRSDSRMDSLDFDGPIVGASFAW